MPRPRTPEPGEPDRPRGRRGAGGGRESRTPRSGRAGDQVDWSGDPDVVLGGRQVVPGTVTPSPEDITRRSFFGFGGRGGREGTAEHPDAGPGSAPGPHVGGAAPRRQALGSGEDARRGWRERVSRRQAAEAERRDDTAAGPHVMPAAPRRRELPNLGPEAGAGAGPGADEGGRGGRRGRGARREETPRDEGRPGPGSGRGAVPPRHELPRGARTGASSGPGGQGPRDEPPWSHIAPIDQDWLPDDWARTSLRDHVPGVRGLRELSGSRRTKAEDSYRAGRDALRAGDRDAAYGRIDAARKSYEAARHWGRAAECNRELARMDLDRGADYDAAVLFRKAEILYQKQYNRSRDPDVLKDVADCKVHQGSIAVGLGNHEQAREMLSDAHGLYLRSGREWSNPRCLELLGMTEHRLGHHDYARDRLNQALTRYQKMGDAGIVGEANTRYHLAQVELWAADGNPADAVNHLERALPLHERARDPLGRADTHFALGEAQLRLGRLDAAGEHFSRSLRLYESEPLRGTPGTGRPLMEANYQVGLWHVRGRRYEAAVEHLSEAHSLAELADVSRIKAQSAKWLAVARSRMEEQGS